VSSNLQVLPLLFCCGMLAACGTEPTEYEPDPDIELYAVAPETVTEVLFSSPDRKLYAYRWSPQGTFEVMIASPDGRLDHCVAGSSFLSWLHSIAHMSPLDGTTTPSTSEMYSERIDIVLRDESDLDPVHVRLLVPSTGSEPAVAEFHSKTFAVDTDLATLRNIESVCG
jgi:hypothetical protein